MGLIIKIAWRNVMRHKGKSIVIGVILFLGALLMTVGNGVISGMDKGLQTNIVNGFTGDIVITSSKQESDNVFIEFMGKSVEPIFNFKQIDSVLKMAPYIDQYLPIGKNTAMVLNDEGGAPGYTYLLGVDFKEYKKMFPNTMKCIEGRFMQDGEKGCLVPTGARKEMFNLTNIWFIAEGTTADTANMIPEAKNVKSSLVYKDNLVLMGLAGDNTTTDVRVGIKGIIKFNALNTIWGSFGFMDIESFRQCFGYFTDEDVPISKSEQKLLSLESQDLDNLFGENTELNSSQNESPTEEPSQLTQKVNPEPNLMKTSGTYNLVLVKLKDHSKLNQYEKELNTLLKEHNLGVRAITWKKAIGTIGSMAILIKSALFVFVLFLFFVAIIIIVNTLSMAALERSSEIGMMRAVGARKSFISSMFFGETAVLSFFFGGLGIVTGIIVVRVISLLNIKTDNDMVQLLYGGDTFQPFLSAADIGLAILQLTIVTLIAVIYPLRVARKITPLDAISRE